MAAGLDWLIGLDGSAAAEILVDALQVSLELC